MTRPITIIIVNWNAGDLLAACIESILRFHSDLVDGVVIVDNASSDESLRRVEALDMESVPLTILRNSCNRGFAASCNQGARLAISEYLLFLNPDARLCEGVLNTSLSFMEENDEVGVVGVGLINEEGSVSRSCCRFPSAARLIAHSLAIDRLAWFRNAGILMQEWPHDATRIVDHVIGAFFFVRKAVYDELDGFDERYFVYFEDIDFSKRSRELGYRSAFLASARAFHKGGGTSQQVKAWRLFYSLQSRLLYAFKHFNLVSRWLVALCILLLEPINRSIYAVLRGKARELLDTWHAYILLYRNLGRTLCGRLEQ